MLLLACTSEADPTSSTSPTEATSPTASPTDPIRYETAACPVADEALCATATEVIQALQSADVDRLFALSREDRLVCADLALEYFPACETDDVLQGHALSGPDFLVEVVDGDGYRVQLEAIMSNVDPSFSDELGDGGVRVIGVGICGPDIPGRRTYHLAWTAAVSETGAPAERLLGSFELTFEDDWRIALWYLGPLEEWELEQPDPLELAFCEAGGTPWPA
jgi:hypothetical protein